MSEGKDIQAVTDMLTVLRLPEGRRVLMLVMDWCGYFHSSHVVDDPGGRKSAYEAGKRAVGIDLKNKIDKADPDAFARLLNERRIK